MSVYYQIKEIGSPFRVEELKDALNEYPSVQFIDGKVNETLPVLYLFYAQSKDDYHYNAEDLGPLENNLQVLPVIKDVKNCGEFIPEPINSTNALELKDTERIERTLFPSWMHILLNPESIFKIISSMSYRIQN